MATVPHALPAGNAGPEAVRTRFGPPACDPDPTVELAPLAFDPDGLTPDGRRLVEALSPSGPDPADAAVVLPAAAAEPATPPARPAATRLERNWWQLRRNLAEVARLVAGHAFGWVAEADRRLGPDDDWPTHARHPLRAAGFVLDNVLGILNAEVCDWWGQAPAASVRPPVPLLDPDPAAVPADVFLMRDKYADLAALLRGAEDDIGRCMADQSRAADFDPRGGPLLHTLTGARLALDIIVREIADDVPLELEAAVARRRVARTRRRKPAAAEAPADPDGA